MKHILTSMLALTLLIGGCVAGGTTDDAVLPLSATNTDGDRILAGTYVPATGEVWFVESAVTSFEASIGETDYHLELEGEAFDPSTSGGFVSLDLEPGASVPVVGRMDGQPDVDVTQLHVESQEWVSQISEEDGNTSFLLCLIIGAVIKGLVCAAAS